jgi:hypothetical protein
MYWRLISRVQRQVGRKQTPKEIRELIFQMVAENPTWGAPRIHGELCMLGFDLSERTLSRILYAPFLLLSSTARGGDQPTTEELRQRAKEELKKFLKRKIAAQKERRNRHLDALALKIRKEHGW